MKIGDRVRTLPHTDAFMRGMRYGEVVKITSNGTRIHVSPDNFTGKRTVAFSPSSLEVVE